MDRSTRPESCSGPPSNRKFSLRINHFAWSAVPAPRGGSPKSWESLKNLAKARRRKVNERVREDRGHWLYFASRRGTDRCSKEVTYTPRLSIIDPLSSRLSERSSTRPDEKHAWARSRWQGGLLIRAAYKYPGCATFSFTPLCMFENSAFIIKSEIVSCTMFSEISMCDLKKK